MAPKMSAKNRYRKISPFEWTYLSATTHFPPFAIQLWIEVDSLSSHAELESALAIAAGANPGARLVPEEGWWIDSGRVPHVRSISGSESFSFSHPYFHAAFSFGDTPPIEIVYWQGAGLIFRCSHALMDAGGLLFFAQETFRALRGEPVLGSHSKISDYDYLARFKHPKSRPWLLPNKKSPLGAPAFSKTGFVWERRTIPGQVSAVGARLASALGKMTQRLHPNGSSRTMLPVDLRQIDSTLRSTCNLSNALFLELPASSTWTEVYCRILEAFGRNDERAVSSLDAIFSRIPISILNRVFRRLHEYQVRNDRYMFSAMVSHVGPVSLSAFSFQGVTPRAVTLLPFDAPGSAITLITIQHENGLEIAASCPAATGEDGRLRMALDLLCEELEQGKHSTSGPNISQTSYEPVDGPRVALPQDLTVYALFAQTAKTFAERRAVGEGGNNLSYGELERLSMECAYRLQMQGIKPGDNVAILSGRCSKTIIALLGILRLGAAFVPLDPEWPAERIRFVLEDCRPSCLLMDEQHASLTDFSPRLLLSELKGTETDFSDVAFQVSPESPAYVLYTSGSTGKPKGVVVGQRSLLNYILWAKEAYLAGLDVPVAFPFFTSLAFDLTLTSLFIPLATGGEIRIFPQRETLLAIRSILSDPIANAIKLTPSHLRLFAGLGVEKSGLRKFVVGGEALPTNLAKEISVQSAGRVDIFNEYGPTEATVGCVVHRFDSEHDVDAFVSIGNPIMNTEVLLLDEKLSLVADGESGEIYLSGECLALGYLARPEENARFSPHPFRAGARVYRTGDRAVRSRNGEFHYRGRIDEQVKVLGHRVELGETEAAIEATGLCRAFAVIPEDAGNGTRLAAFVSFHEGACEADLRMALADALPGYMIPSRIVGLDHIPLNVNGKVDKARLPVDRQPSPKEVAPSHGGIEGKLTEIVSGLTGGAFTSIPQDESLLELGLDSLQMMLLLTAAARQFLPDSAHDLLFSALGEYFEDPTIQTLARHLRILIADQLK
jgi:amino acid adenylation domain-containing protein